MMKKSAMLFFWMAISVSPTTADHIDPTDVVTQAFQTFKETQDNAAVRAVFSKALRDAPHDGVLDPSFALIFAMYSDIARFEGDPSFAMDISQRGLDLLLTDKAPDPNVLNTLLVSQAYALADLGRYAQAIEQARIQLIWMANEFGQSQAEALQREVDGWQQKAVASDANYQLPSVAELSEKLLDQAHAAYDVDDTTTAQTLAARALVPAAGTGLSEQAIKLLNVRAHTISGQAFAKESRYPNAMTAYRRAVDIATNQPWNGAGEPKLDPQFLAQTAGPSILWELFSSMAATAANAREYQLANAALGVAARFADTPARRTDLLFQQAGNAFRNKDYSGAERAFLDGAVAARESGDEQTASLAEFYLAVARLFLARAAGTSSVAPQLQALAVAADNAQRAAGDNILQAEYILTTATKVSYFYRFNYADIRPLADKALAAFVRRQSLMSDNEIGQNMSRADQRSFLEIFIGAQYDARRAQP